MRLATDMLDISVGLEEQFSIELSNTEDADMAEVLRRFTEVQAQYDINIQLTSSNRTLNLFQRMWSAQTCDLSVEAFWGFSWFLSWMHKEPLRLRDEWVRVYSPIDGLVNIDVLISVCQLAE